MQFSRRAFGLLIGSASACVVGLSLTHNASAAEALNTAKLTIKKRDGNFVLARGASSFSRRTIKTHTPWTEGIQEFSGVLLKDILSAAGIDEETARSSKLIARALNDYEVEIPAADIYRYDIIVADKMNGQDMPISKYGPFWIIYPRDEHSEIQDARYDHRWVWQLTELRVE